jgi:type I restriction enzyme S subunit
VNDDNSNVLPSGWVWTTLGKLSTHPQYGYTTSASNVQNGIRFLRITDIKSGGVEWENVPYCTEIPDNVESYILHHEDIVIGRSGSVGKAYLVINPPPAVFASYLIRFQPIEVDRRYLAYFLQSSSYWRQIKDASAGNTLQNVNAQKLASIKLPLAPLAEQNRIVDVIEAEFTRLDAGVAALKRLHANLKRYKAAVLKSAAEGKLVPQDPSDEPASELLQRILQERRQKWEDEQRAKGRDPRKLKYEEPKAPDTADLPELPDGWVWASVETACERIVDCLHTTPSFQKDGFICIDTNSIKPGQIVTNKIRYVDEPTFHERNRRMKPKAGDVMFSREGALLGVAVVVPDDMEICLGQRMMIFRIAQNVAPKFFECVLNSALFRAQYVPKIGGSASPHLNIGDIRKMVIPIPPINAQSRIADALETSLSIIDEIEHFIARNLKRAERLRQAILREAFAGRLAAQDPNDEPASELIKRIQQARAERVPVKRKAKR